MMKKLNYHSNLAYEKANSQCFVKGCNNHPVEFHHIFFNSRKRASEKYGFIVPLCWEHHRGTYGVHGRDGRELDLALKQYAQKLFEVKYGTREDFIAIFRKSYL